MGEESSQGITRRDLLRRGAVLGGAVVWTTPVVQTLGMGRAFANTASPVDGGKDVSYVVISWQCSGSTKKVKWDNGFALSGNLPDCGDVGGEYADSVPQGLNVMIDPSNKACIRVDVPEAGAFGCDVSNVQAWIKAGSSNPNSAGQDVCTPTSLLIGVSGQSACTGG